MGNISCKSLDLERYNSACLVRFMPCLMSEVPDYYLPCRPPATTHSCAGRRLSNRPLALALGDGEPTLVFAIFLLQRPDDLDASTVCE